MGTPRDSKHAHSASSPQTEERLRSRYLDFNFEPNLKLANLVTAEGNQVRLIEHRAPATMVARYAEQMKAGAVFPAIVVNDRYEVIDGNTRWQAAKKAGKDTIAAYICSGVTALQARSLSVELNQCHGLSMSEEELYAFVVGVVQEGHSLDAKAYARMTGVRAGTLSRWVAQANFLKRARAVEIPDAHVTILSQSCQAALNPVRLTPVLRELTALAAASKMSATDVRQLVAMVNAAASESDALGLVRTERENRSEHIRAIASGFARNKGGASRATMHVAALLKVDLAELLDVAPEKRLEAFERLEQLRDRIDLALSPVGHNADPDAELGGAVVLSGSCTNA